MGHLLAWQEVALRWRPSWRSTRRARRKARADADWDARGGEVVNAEIDATLGALPMDELRERFRDGARASCAAT